MKGGIVERWHDGFFKKVSRTIDLFLPIVRALWGGFVLSGPSGNVYFSGDTGYPHFREIARRFSPIKVALLPISPFRLKSSNPPSTGHHLPLHMGPGEAVQAHLDLGAKISIAAHFQVFQLGADKFDDAVQGLAQALKEGNLKPDTFLVLTPGQAKDWPTLNRNQRS